MAIELVTGKKGTVHVDSADDGALYAAIAGKGEYVLDLDDRLACTMTTANKAHVASGHGLMQGRHWLVDAEGVDLTIQNGTQGQKRNDLIVARYECDAKNGNVESVALKVIKGTPTTGTPADPACTRGDILEGAALVNEQPLWRIPLNGITVGTPVQLFDVLTPAKEAWDTEGYGRTSTATENLRVAVAPRLNHEKNLKFTPSPPASTQPTHPSFAGSQSDTETAMTDEALAGYVSVSVPDAYTAPAVPNEKLLLAILV